MKKHILHPIPPFYDKESKILILGSFPSVKSREQMFFYGHPQNRFWKVIASVFYDKEPDTVSEKKPVVDEFLQTRIAETVVLITKKQTKRSLARSSLNNQGMTNLSVCKGDNVNRYNEDL